MQKKKEQSSEELYGELGQAFNFTQGDLEANRAGFVSYRQKKLQQQRLLARLLSYYSIEFIGLAAFGLFLLVLAAFLPFVSCHFSLCNSNNREIDMFQTMSGFLMLSLVVTVLDASFFGFQYFRDMRDGRVRVYTSQVHKDGLTSDNEGYLQNGGRYGGYLKKYPNGQRLFLTKAQYELAWTQLPYKTYYLPHTNAILSIEVTLPE